MAVIKKTIEVKLNRCERCGYEWKQRRRRMPKVCSQCKSYDWNVPRIPKSSLPEKEQATV